MTTTPLPAHLADYWTGKPDPRLSPVFCPKQSHKTPAIPWHNGWSRCISCGKDSGRAA